MKSVHNVLIFCVDLKCKEALERFLASSSLELLSAHGMGDLMSKAAQSEVDLMVVDVGSLGTKGFESIQKLKQDPTTREVPILLIADSELLREEAVQAGCADVLVKPLEKEAVISKVEITIRMNEVRGLIDEKTKFDNILDALQDGIVVLDKELRIEKINEKAKMLLALPVVSHEENFIETIQKLFKVLEKTNLEKIFIEESLLFRLERLDIAASLPARLELRTKLVKNVFSQPSAVVVVIREPS